MGPTFVGDRWYWGLMRCATHLVKFPDASVYFFDDCVGIQALPTGTNVILALPSVLTLTEPDVAPGIAALAKRKCNIVGCFGKSSRADELAEALKEAGCQIDIPMLLDSLITKRAVEKTAAWPISVYKPMDSRQRELTATLSVPLPALTDVEKAHWSLLAYFGLGSAPEEFIRLAQLLARSETPDEWAASRILDGTKLLTEAARAFRVERIQARTIAIFNPGIVGPKAGFRYLAVGDTASQILVRSASVEKASALVISMPVPGSPEQIVIQTDNETYDLAKAVGATESRGLGPIVVKGELDTLLSRLREFYSTLN